MPGSFLLHKPLRDEAFSFSFRTRLLPVPCIRSMLVRILLSLPSKYPQEEVAQRVARLLSKLTLEENQSLAGDGYDGMSTVDIPRLGIPKLQMSDGPQGIRAHGPACSFPSGIALAATWILTLPAATARLLEGSQGSWNPNVTGPGVNIARTL